VATRHPDPGPRIPAGRAGPIVQATKLQPPRWRTGSVRRPRLTGLLRASRPTLTLIVAPPGFGKTSLLADWAGIDGRPFAWVTAEPEDNDQAVLWSSIVPRWATRSAATASSSTSSSRPPVTRIRRRPSPGSSTPCPASRPSCSTTPSACAATTPITP
jgi:hypothetical protein